MSLTQVNVATPTGGYAIGAQPTLTGGKSGEELGAALHPPYYTQTYNGNAFIGNTGSVVPVLYTSTAPTMVLWNPAGSNVNVVVNRLWVTQTIASATASNLVIAAGGNLGTQLGGTGAPITAYTSGTVTTTKLGSGIVPKAIFANGATIATSPSVICTVSVEGTVALTSVPFGAPSILEFAGGLIITPGYSIVGALLAAATTGAYVWNIHWTEFPV